MNFANLIITSASIDIEKTLIPTVLFLLVCQVYLYNGTTIKYRIRGLLQNLCVSYIVIHVVNSVLSVLLQELLNRISNNSVYVRLIASIISLDVVFFVFAFIFIKQVDERNSFPGVEKTSKYFGFFVYIEYNLILICASSYAKTPLKFVFIVIVLSIVCVFLFHKDMNIIMHIYSKKLSSAENYCLLAQILLCAIFFNLPFTVNNSHSTGLGRVFIMWMELISITLYLFCMLVSKLLFLQIYHAFKEKIRMSVDELTGLQNRRSFLDFGQRYIENNVIDNCAIVFINIARFKAINANYGKSMGDSLLVSFSSSMKKIFEDAVIISRISDDHFAIITENLNTIDINLMQSRKLAVKEINCEFVIKAGVYIVNNGEMDLSVALDNAILASKTAGVSNTLAIQYFDKKVLEEQELSNYIKNNIDRAVKENVLKVYYQPIVDPKTGMYKSAEALVRWNEDSTGFLSPGKFVPTLERENLIYKVDCFVIEQVCKDHKYLIENGLPTLPVSFNISRRDFFVIDMVDYVEKMLHKYDLPKELFKIEITESAFCEDDNYVIEQMKRFSELGYKLWMDDFGSGYSSLNLLGTFRFDGIKLDMVFLKDLTTMKKELMRGIVSTAKLLGIEVLTEGVETKEQLDLIIDIDCDLAQGYKFSMPKSFEEHLNTSRKKVSDD